MIEPFLGGSDALLQFADFGVQVGLVSHGGRHAAQQRGNFRARLHEPENVVDEEQHVQTFFIAEIFRDGQAGQSDAQARAGRFRHLPVDQRGARFFRIARHDDARFLHFQPQVVAFARAFAHAGEHGHAAVLHGDVVNQLLNQNRLAHARAAEQADFAALQVRLEQVHDLDSGLEHFERSWIGLPATARDGGSDSAFPSEPAEAVHGLAEDVHHAPQRCAAHGNGDRPAQIDGLHAAHDAFGRVHCDGAHAALAQVLRDFGDDVDRLGSVEAFAGDAHRVVNFRQVMFGKLHVDDRPDDLHDVPDVSCFVLRHLWLLRVPSGQASACRFWFYSIPTETVRLKPVPLTPQTLLRSPLR